MLNIHIMPTRRIGAFIADGIEDVVVRKPDALIGWTTGNTPLRTGIYRELIEREQAGRLSFRACSFVNPDEYIGIPRGHAESYYTYMRKHFFDSIDHPEECRYISDGMASDLEAECEAMERWIEERGGIDYQLSGLGINGHICFIEPAAALPARSFVTGIAEMNRRLYAPLFGSLEAVPARAITFGWGTVLKARKFCLVATGAEKADMVARALIEPVTTELPASLVQLHADAEVVLDEAAAARYLAEYDGRAQAGIRVVHHS